MKKIILCTFLFLILPYILLAASWTDDFLRINQTEGLDHAVEQSLKEGIPPQAILLFVQSSQEISEEMTLRALYCSGSDPNEVRQDAINIGIKKNKVERALVKSIAECGTQLVVDDRISSTSFASPSQP